MRIHSAPDCRMQAAGRIAAVRACLDLFAIKKMV